MPEEPETPNEEQGTDIYDQRSYVINITFNCPITNLHIEQYGKPVSPPPPTPG